MGLLSRFGRFDKKVLNQEHYRNNLNDNSTYDVLPVLFIPYFVRDKLAAKSITVEDFVKMLPVINEEEKLHHMYNDTMAELEEEHNKLLDEVMTVIGISDMTAMQSLNNVMFSGGSHTSMYRLLNYHLNENVNNSEFIKLKSSMSNLSDGSEYTIEKLDDCFIIIMNNNSMTMLDETYKKLCEDLCRVMLKFVDESFVFQSVFFKSL